MDDTAKKLITDNMALVPYIIKKKFGESYRTYEDFSDILQEGYYALSLAASRYDPAKGVKFTTFAGAYIKFMIIRYMREHQSGGIHIPRPILDNKAKIMRYVNDNYMDSSYENIAEVSRKFNIKETGIYGMVSFNPIIDNNEEDETKNDIYSNIIPYIEEEYDNKELEYLLQEFLDSPQVKKLKGSKKAVLELLIESWKTEDEYMKQTEIAEEVGISQAQVSRDISEVKKLFRKFIESI